MPPLPRRQRNRGRSAESSTPIRALWTRYALAFSPRTGGISDDADDFIETVPLLQPFFPPATLCLPSAGSSFAGEPRPSRGPHASAADVRRSFPSAASVCVKGIALIFMRAGHSARDTHSPAYMHVHVPFSRYSAPGAPPRHTLRCQQRWRRVRRLRGCRRPRGRRQAPWFVPLRTMIPSPSPTSTPAHTLMTRYISMLTAIDCFSRTDGRMDGRTDGCSDTWASVSPCLRVSPSLSLCVCVCVTEP